MSRNRVLPVVAAALAMSMVSAQIASAACTRLAFSVNDYGKEGPIRDAKNLLDKYIAKWASDRGIKGYNTGPKAVSCELFLDVIVFDEYTCKAEATVCWNGPLPKGHSVEAGAGASTPSVNKAAQGGAQRAKAAPKAAAGEAPAGPAAGAAPIATGSVRAVPAVAPKAAPAATPAAVVTPAAVPKAAPAAAAPAPAASPVAPAAAPVAPPAN